MAELINPVHGFRDAQRRKGIKPHDFTRDNRAHIKALQKLNKERREAAAAATTPRQSPRYAGIGSRVTAQLARPATADSAMRPPPKPSEPKPFACPKPSGPAGRIFTAWAPPPLLHEGAPELEPGPRKPPVPRRDERATAAPPPAVDFVKRNAELLSLTPKKTAAAAAVAPSPPGTGGKSRYHGRLPPYLLDRKLELVRAAEDKEAAARPRECPEGTHILAEEERVRVLGMVRQGQQRVHAELDKMPFVVDTYGLKAKHEALSHQLAQLEAAEKAFDRRKVVVQDDDAEGAAPLESAPPPLPTPLEHQLTDRLKAVLDEQLHQLPNAADASTLAPPPDPLTVEDL